MPEDGNTSDGGQQQTAPPVTQADIEALKSSFSSTIDKAVNGVRSSVLDEILPLVEKGDGSKPATEFGKKRDEVASQREREKQAEIEAQKLKDRDEFWEAKTEAIYKLGFPAEAFEGLGTAADIRRQTAVLKMFKPAGETTPTPGGTGRAGAGSPGATDPTEGMDSAEKTYHAINKSFPMQPGVQWQSAGS